MDRTKTSTKRRGYSSKKQNIRGNKVAKKQHVNEFSIKEDANLITYDPVKNLLDVNKMGAAIMQCFLDNDTEGVLEIVENYLYAMNKTQFLKDANVPRSTVYNFFKRRNPTIKTLAKIMHATVHSQCSV